jgi:hypothetical protein
VDANAHSHAAARVAPGSPVPPVRPAGSKRKAPSVDGSARCRGRSDRATRAGACEQGPRASTRLPYTVVRRRRGVPACAISPTGVFNLAGRCGAHTGGCVTAPRVDHLPSVRQATAVRACVVRRVLAARAPAPAIQTSRSAGKPYAVELLTRSCARRFARVRPRRTLPRPLCRLRPFVRRPRPGWWRNSPVVAPIRPTRSCGGRRVPPEGDRATSGWCGTQASYTRTRGSATWSMPPAPHSPASLKTLRLHLTFDLLKIWLEISLFMNSSQGKTCEDWLNLSHPSDRRERGSGRGGGASGMTRAPLQ